MRILGAVVAVILTAVTSSARAAPSAYELHQSCTAYHVPPAKREREDWIRAKQCEAGIEDAVRQLGWPTEIPGALAALENEISQRATQKPPTAVVFQAAKQLEWLVGEDPDTIARRIAAYCPGAISPSGKPFVATERIINIVMRYWDANPPGAVLGRFASSTEAVRAALTPEFPGCAGK